MSEQSTTPPTPAHARPDSAKNAKQDARKAALDLADIFPFSVSVSSVYDGPLDLLLDLIRKQDIDIYDIPIAQITAQYLAYVEHIRNFDIDLAAEFIYMASLLIHIKSKMLLPRDPDAPARRTGPANGTGQPPARTRTLQAGGADAIAETAARRSRTHQSRAQGIPRCRGHGAGVGRRRHRSGTRPSSRFWIAPRTGQACSLTKTQLPWRR